MKFAEVRTYVKGILKSFFLNKKILDKFGYNDDSDTLLYDDYPIGERINTNDLKMLLNCILVMMNIMMEVVVVIVKT